MVAWDLANFWPVDAEEMFRIERQAYAHAVEIAPDQPEVLARRAWEEFEINNDWQRAAELLERAVSIAPGEVRVLYVAANLAHMTSSFDISERFRKRMLEIDPLCIDCVYGLMRGTYVARQYDEALEWHAKYKGMGGNGGHFTLTKIRLHRGEPELALEAAERMEKRFAGDAARAMAIYSLGQEDEARELLHQIDETIYRNNAQVIAEAWAWIGDVEAAFAALEAEYGESDYKHFFMRTNDPVYDNIRNDPRWQAALARVNLSDEQRAAIRYNPQLPD